MVQAEPRGTVVRIVSYQTIDYYMHKPKSLSRRHRGRAPSGRGNWWELIYTNYKVEIGNSQFPRVLFQLPLRYSMSAVDCYIECAIRCDWRNKTSCVRG